MLKDAKARDAKTIKKKGKAMGLFYSAADQLHNQDTKMWKTGGQPTNKGVRAQTYGKKEGGLGTTGHAQNKRCNAKTETAKIVKLLKLLFFLLLRLPKTKNVHKNGSFNTHRD